MKTTPFTAIHKALGAKMHESAGCDMPIEYSTGIIDEHHTVIKGVCVFDFSHMGKFWVKGPKALQFVQDITSNDASKLKVGDIQYTCFPNADGGIIDDLLVYHYEDEKYLLVVNNATNIEKDWAWCQAHNAVGAELENSSDNIDLLAVSAANIDKVWAWCQAHNAVGAELENSSDNIDLLEVLGPLATEVLQRLTSVNLSEIPYYTFKVGEFAGCPDVILSNMSNTGDTGAGRFELYFEPQYGEKIWNAIFEAGRVSDAYVILISLRRGPSEGRRKRPSL